MKRLMPLEQFFKSGARVNAASAFGLAIGREVAASARRHLWRARTKDIMRGHRGLLRPLVEADHILMHAERGDGTCSQCPPYVLNREARRG